VQEWQSEQQNAPFTVIVVVVMRLFRTEAALSSRSRAGRRRWVMA